MQLVANDKQGKIFKTLDNLKKRADTLIDYRVNSLNKLLQRIQNDTQPSMTNFRIFAIFEPKIRILVTIDNLSALAARISSLTPKLQDLINNLKSQGKNVSSLQPLPEDINSNLTTTASPTSTP